MYVPTYCYLVSICSFSKQLNSRGLGVHPWLCATYKTRLIFLGPLMSCTYIGRRLFSMQWSEKCLRQKKQHFYRLKSHSKVSRVFVKMLSVVYPYSTYKGMTGVFPLLPYDDNTCTYACIATYIPSNLGAQKTVYLPV